MVCLLSVALGISIFSWLGPALLTLISSNGFNEDNIRAYVREYIKSRPELSANELVIQDVTIEKMNLHDQELRVAKVRLRTRGDFETWTILYLVSSPDYSTYVIGESDQHDAVFADAAHIFLDGTLGLVVQGVLGPSVRRWFGVRTFAAAKPGSRKALAKGCCEMDCSSCPCSKSRP